MVSVAPGYEVVGNLREETLLLRIREDTERLFCILDEVRAAAGERAAMAKEALGVLPDSEEKRLLAEIADYFITRGN